MLDKIMKEVTIGLTLPVEKFNALAHAYLKFAQNHTNLWRALFDMNYLSGGEMPEWYKEEQRQLLNLICAPLADLYPNMDERALAVRARTVFSSVHGIVMVSMEERFISLTGQELEDELNHFVHVLAFGASHAQG
jgi:hypothetical protein